ncbi:MAG: DUF1194 domain-containing protein, partial [Pseudomonadota bacterium]
MRWFGLQRLGSLVLCALLIAPLPAAATEVEVDVQLFLAVDVSRSMSPRELEIQRRGYAEALVSEPVVKAIRSGLLGRVALTYVEWAGPFSQRVIVPWTMVENQRDAQAFAAKISTNFNPAMRRTSISGAVQYATGSFTGNGFISNRRVIDVSGDGPNNQGRPVLVARDEAIEAGFIINGLPLMTREGLGASFGIDNLDAYYRDCVIGGPGAFVIPVYTWDQFPAAVRRKLVLELAGRAPALPLHRASAKPKADCLVGEKMWQMFRDRSFMP